jgi:hypothetical protein
MAQGQSQATGRHENWGKFEAHKRRVFNARPHKVLDQHNMPADAAEIVGKCVADIRTYFAATRKR